MQKCNIIVMEDGVFHLILTYKGLLYLLGML